MSPIPETSPQKPKGNHTRAVFLGIALMAGLVWLGFTLFSAPPAPPAKPQVATVQTALATRSDVPQYLEGIGTVQALNTVTVNARVDGQLQQIAFTEGQAVKQGDLLAQIDPRPYQTALDLATATKSKDQAQLENAKRDLDRYMILAPKNLASKQTVDTQQALVDQLDAQIKADQANIDSAKTQLDYTMITSPINGRTGIRLVDVGNNVHATDTKGIVMITQVQPISLIFTLPEEALTQVNQAMTQGSVGVAALSQDDKTVLDNGTLLLIDNQIDQTTGTIKLKATFPNADNKLWPGQFVNARLLLDVKHQALTIPSAAAERGPEGMFVYVVKPDSTIEARPLKTGVEMGKNLLVESGLQEGERVVTSNQYRLQPGIAVKVESDEAKPATASGSAQ
ncbi:MAG: efflux RND transporter periplasmic adaptor subunit [Alphaproteobacteria bacterium]